MTGLTQPMELRGENPPASLKKRDRARFLTQQFKASVQDRLHNGGGGGGGDDDDDNDDEQDSASHDQMFDDAAFDPQKALRPDDKTESSIAEKLTFGAKTVVNAIKNPKAFGRMSYTRHAVAKMANHPHFQSTALDDELLEAHDDLASAQDRYKASDRDRTGTPIHSEHAVKVVEARSRVGRIEEQRDNLKSGWVLGRHVVRVKAVRPMTSKPVREQYLAKLATSGQPPRLRVGPYLGHLILWYTAPLTAHRIDDYDEPPFDLGELFLAAERLAAVSIPWQTFASRIREVYRWENPTHTLRIMFTYWTLWYFRSLMSFGVGYVIYATLRNRIYPARIQAMREKAKRSRDQSAAVKEWGELIQKHGGSDWVEPLLDGLGPHLQLQLGDLTIFLERLQNFYQWAQPRSTMLTLCIFLSGFIFLRLASTQLCVDLFWFGMGLWFFFTTPIATNYPKFRHVVSPFCWLFWTVPDAAELAISQLQQKVASRDDTRVQALQDEQAQVYPQRTQESNAASNPSSFETQRGTESTSADSSRYETDLLNQVRSDDQLKFKTNLLPSHLPGYVVLSRTHITFETKDKVMFSYPYSAVVEISKVDLNTSSNEAVAATGVNKLSRLTHMVRSVERNEDIQILPDGLGFVFLQDDATETDPGDSRTSSGSGHHTSMRTTGQMYDTCTDTEPAPDPRTVPQSRSSVRPRSNDLETATTSPADMSNEQKKGITLLLNKSDRDKIFAVVLAWSNMNWQPLYSMNRQNKLGTGQKGSRKGEAADGSRTANGSLDDAIKRALI